MVIYKLYENEAVKSSSNPRWKSMGLTIMIRENCKSLLYNQLYELGLMKKYSRLGGFFNDQIILYNRDKREYKIKLV